MFSLIVIILIAALAIYAVRYVPLDTPLRNIIVVLIILVAIFFVARLGGYA